MEHGFIEGWEALELICFPPQGSRLENPPLERQFFSNEVKDECRRLYKEGLSVPEVARRTGVTYATAKSLRLRPRDRNDRASEGPASWFCRPCHGRAHRRESMRRQDARRRDES